MQQLDNDDEGKDDDGDKNDSEEAIKTKEKCKAEAIASAEANTDTGYYHHGIGYSVIADISTWEKEIRKNAAVSLGSCSVKDSIKENIIGTSSMVIIGRLHNIIASIGPMRRITSLARDYAFSQNIQDYPLHVQTMARMGIETRGCCVLLMP